MPVYARKKGEKFHKSGMLEIRILKLVLNNNKSIYVAPPLASTIYGENS